MLGAFLIIGKYVIYYDSFSIFLLFLQKWFCKYTYCRSKVSVLIPTSHLTTWTGFAKIKAGKYVSGCVWCVRCVCVVCVCMCVWCVVCVCSVYVCEMWCVCSVCVYVVCVRCVCGVCEVCVWCLCMCVSVCGVCM